MIGGIQVANIRNLISKDNCTGCGACVFECPINAIELKRNHMNCKIASVGDRCIDCGKCVKLCPQIKSTDHNVIRKVYAGFPVNDDKRDNYTSGGAASIISKSFIENFGGKVCGCLWNSNEKKAQHIVTDDINTLCKFTGSKYVESDISAVYEDICENIKNNTPVLFIGTPCQVSAMKKSFKSDLLYTIDLICHGVPSDYYLTEYLNSFTFSKSINDVKFRGKYDFWMTIIGDNENIKYKMPKNCDLYFSSFLNGISYRENCYHCKYANTKRVGDLTLGDFWGLEHSSLKKAPKGRVSLILENTEKGSSLLKLIENIFYMEERSIEEAVKENKQLSAPMNISEDRREFVRKYPNSSFIDALKNTSIYSDVKTNVRNYRINLLKQRIKKILRG